MPDYIVTSPAGEKFRVTAPEGATQDQVLAYAQQKFEQPSAPQMNLSPEQTAMAQQSPSFAAQLASAAVRPVVKGLTAVPGMFADATVAAYNLLRPKSTSDLISPGSGNMQLPSQALDDLLNKYTLQPEGIGKVAEAVSSGLVGSRVPIPQVGQQPPAGFTPARDLTIAQQTFQRGRDAGYVAPPATVNRSGALAAAEGLGGKAATQQVASLMNQRTTNELARRALKLPEGTQLSLKAIESVRGEAGKVYKAVANSGKITTDAQYIDDLSAIGAQADEIAKAFPEANVGKSAEIDKMINSLLRDKFDTRPALEYLKELRKQASANLSHLNAADPAKRSLGIAQRDAAAALEDMIIRHLQANGKGILARTFNEARTLIAKTHSVENALNPSTGNVVARNLVTQLKTGKPLSGELKLAADFARAFPKATDEVTNSGPVSALDALIAGGGGYTIDPAMLAWPFMRIVARRGLLSSPVQNALLPGGGRSIPPSVVMGAIPPIREVQ